MNLIADICNNTLTHFYAFNNFNYPLFYAENLY